MPRELLTAAEAAAYLRRTPKALRDLRYRGTGPAYIAGARVLYDRADLDAWLDAQRVAA